MHVASHTACVSGCCMLKLWCATLSPNTKQVPDFTSALTSEVEAQRFVDATATDLPKVPKGSTAEERRAPIGKVVLFTNKGEVPGVYKALAMHFAGRSRLLFAWARATTDAGPGSSLMQKMNVSVPAGPALHSQPLLVNTACVPRRHSA